MANLQLSTRIGRMPRILEWKNSEDPRDIVHVMVQSLVEGKLVAAPAETAYHVLASGLKPDAVEQLAALPGRYPPNRQPVIFLRSSQESFDYSPQNPGGSAIRQSWLAWPARVGRRVCPRDKPRRTDRQLTVQRTLISSDQFLSHASLPIR